MSSTISGTLTVGTVFGTGAYSSPLTVTASGYVEANPPGSSGAALYSSYSGAYAALYNFGRIKATGSIDGVREGNDNGLTIANSGSIGAVYGAAVDVQQAGPIANTGTIKARNLTGTSTIANGIYFSGSGNTITNTGANALIFGEWNGIYGKNTLSVTNSGTIVGYENAAVTMSAGAVNNSKLIVGAYHGVNIGSTGSVNNSGSILSAYGIKIGGDGTVTNSSMIFGSNGIAIELSSGGYISSSSAGTITTDVNTFSADYTGIKIDSGAATIVNAGMISAEAGIVFAGSSNQTIVDSGKIVGAGTIAGSAGTAVAFSSGADLLQFTPSATVGITGTINGGGGINKLEFTSAASTGTLTGTSADFLNFAQGTIDSGASWVLAGTETFASSTTLANAGTLQLNGTLTNAGSLASSGTLKNSGILNTSGPLTLSSGAYLGNTGSIIATAGAGIVATGAVQIVNYGLIDPPGPGVYLMAGGTLTNAGTGYIGGGAYGVQINSADSATITNAGTISGVVGVTVTGVGVADQTVADSGTIIGTGGTAIAFGGGDDLLQLTPSASVYIEGIVDGGGGTNTLELASAASTGTLTGLGTSFVNFGAVTVDNAAYWVLAGDNTIANSTTLTNSGTLLDTGTLTVAGTISAPDLVGATGVLVSGYLYNTRTGLISGYIGVGLQTGGSLVNAGSIHGYDRGVTLGNGATITNTGSITGPAGAVAVYARGDNYTAVITNGATNATTAYLYGYQGIQAFGNNDAFTVVNYGTIEGGSGGIDARGIYISNGTIINGPSGVTGALVESGNIGVYTQYGTVLNYGTILGVETGVVVTDSGTVRNHGTIQGNSGTAVSLEGSASVLVLYSGAVITGVASGNGSGDLLELASSATAGTITGIGTSFTGFGTITVDSGAQWTITGGNTLASGTLLNIYGTVDNIGTITVSGTASVTLLTGGYLDNGGYISTDTFAVSGYGATGNTVVNSGTIVNTGYGADILLATGGYAHNEGVLVAGTQSNGIDLGASGTVVNSGHITALGTPSYGIELNGGGAATNTTGGYIQGGIEVSNGSGVVANAGSIGGLYFYGVHLRQGGTVTDTGRLTGSNAGIRIDGDGYVSIGTGGYVGAGHFSGILITGTATVINYGSIQSGSVPIISGGTGTGYFGVYAELGGTLTNTSTGQITGGVGVAFRDGVATAINYGTITGTALQAVAILDGGSLYNTGLITGTGTYYPSGSGPVGAVAFDGAAGTITNYGTITAAYGAFDGVDFFHGGSVNNTGTISGGYFGVYVDGGSGIVTNTNTIQSLDAARYAVAFRDGGGVTNSGTGIIYGGVSIGSAAGTVVNGGLISDPNAGGIALTHGGRIVDTGIVTAASEGIAAFGSRGIYVSVGSAGTIQGGAYGIAFTGTPSTIVDDGLIASTRIGVLADGEAAVVTIGSGGAITGGAYGVVMAGADGSLTNDGSVNGTAGIGILLETGASIDNAAGAYVGGAQYGVLLSSYYAGRVLNYGTIKGGIGIYAPSGPTPQNQTVVDGGEIVGTGGTAVAFGGGNDLLKLMPSTSLQLQGIVDGGSGTSTLEFSSAASAGTVSGPTDFVNFANATIDSGAYWVFAGSNTIASTTTLTNSGTLLNTGSVTGTGEFIVNPSTFINTGYFGLTVTLAGSGNIVGNTSTGTISAPGTAIVSTGANTIENQGSVSATGTGSVGISLTAGGTVVNGAGAATGASIAGYLYGVKAAGAAATVTNYGTIQATGAHTGVLTGVYLSDGGYVGNLGTGALAYGAVAGIRVTSGTVVNQGMAAGGLGIHGGDHVTIFNSGTAGSGSSTTGIAVGGYGTIVNSGTAASIYGHVRGVLTGLNADVTNAGTIRSELALGGAYGVELQSGDLTNVSTGLIEGEFSAVVIDQAGSVINAGMITENKTGSGSESYAGVWFSGNYNGTLANSGTIAAASGGAVAVRFSGNGTDRVIIDPGAVFTGNVLGGSGSNTLELASAAGAGTVGGIGSKYQNFGTITVDSGAQWTITGVNTLANGVTLTDAGMLTNAGTITGAGDIIVDPKTFTNTGYDSVPITLTGTGDVLTNTSTGIITGTNIGVYFLGNGTVVDAGTISGGAAAIAFGPGGSGSNLVVLEHGYSVSGGITAGSATNNTVELLGTSPALSVAVNYNTLSLTNFGAVVFAPGNSNYATLTITNTASLPGTIAGFAGIHDIVNLTQLSDADMDAVATLDTATNVLTVTGDNGSVQLQLDAENYNGVYWTVTGDGHGGSDVLAVNVPPPPITETLADDTGVSGTDDITSDPTVTGGGDANATVTISEGTTTLGTAAANGSGVWTFGPTGLADGSHTLVANETNDGITGTASLTFTLDTTAPAVAITSSPTFTDQATQTITGTVGDANLPANATITLFDNGTQIGTTTESGGAWAGSITLPTEGSNAITAEATDLAGNTGTGAADTLTLDTIAPAVSITTSGTITNQATQMITGTVSDANLAANATIALFDNGTQIGTTTESDGAWTTSITLSAQGANAITARATDLAGNTGTSAADTLILDTTPPTEVKDTALQLPTGGTATIPGSLLEFLDNLSSDAQETYTVTSAPQYGTLLLNGAPAGSFTQTDIDAGRVTYQETAPTATTDSFGFTVGDAPGNTTGAESFGFNISPTQPGASFGFFEPPGVTINLVFTTDGSNPPAPVPGDFNLEVITQPTQASYPLPPGYQGLATFPGGSGKALDLIAGDIDVADNGFADSIAGGPDTSTIGGAQGDTIVGGTGTEFIDGSQGFESITGGSAGDETIWGGSGDVVNGGGADETIGGVRFDTLVGGTGAELIDGSAGNQSITGGSAGNETVYAGAGDTINGGTGANDTVNSLAGDDTIQAGTGNTIVYDGAGDVAEDPSGNAYFTFTAGSSAVVLGLTAAAALAYAGANDTLTGGAGTATIIGAVGAYFVLGSGTDTVNAIPANETVTFGGGSATVYGGPGDTIGDAAGTVATFDGGANAIVVAGTGNSVLLYSGAGDTLTAGAAPVTMIGAAGDDIILGAAQDTVNAFPGNEVVELGSAPFQVIYGGVGDTIEAAGGSPLVTFQSGSQGIIFASGNPFANQVNSGPGDTLAIGAGQTNVVGAAGDTITLGSGASLVNAQPSDESVTFGTGNATVLGGVGDTIAGAAGTYVVFDGGGNPITVSDFDGGIRIDDGAGDTITAGDASSAIHAGGAASSSIILGSAADTVTGANGDTITTGAGSDSIDLGQFHSAGEFLAPGSGNDAGANDTVVNFDQATGDRILETGTAETNSLVSAQSSGGNTTLTLADGSTLTLVGVTAINAGFFS